MKSNIIALIKFFAFALSLLDGTYLVMNAHYGWAWIPFLIAVGLSDCELINVNCNKKNH